jgi:hypothetical protein
MGYASTIPYSLMEVSGQNKDLITVPNGWLALTDLVDIVVPSFKGKLDYAYLDVVVQQYENTNAATNDLEDGETGIDDGGTFRQAAVVASAANPVFYQLGTTRGTCFYQITGYNNIAAYISSGETITVQAYHFKAAFANMKLMSIACKLRLYLDVL